jgi:hypothetical protein
LVLKIGQIAQALATITALVLAVCAYTDTIVVKLMPHLHWRDAIGYPFSKDQTEPDNVAPSTGIVTASEAASVSRDVRLDGYVDGKRVATSEGKGAFIMFCVNKDQRFKVVRITAASNDFQESNIVRFLELDN